MARPLDFIRVELLVWGLEALPLLCAQEERVTRVMVVLCGVVLCLFSSASFAQEAVPASALVGSWRVVSLMDADGKASVLPTKPTDNFTIL